jgi:N-acyl-L-homoserine lactone synthetase
MRHRELIGKKRLAPLTRIHLMTNTSSKLTNFKRNINISGTVEKSDHTNI